MSKIKHQYESNYKSLVKRDGERCFMCKKKGEGEPLIIDHWDNNRENNDESNLHLLCRSCNTRKNPRGNGKRGIRVKETLNGKARSFIQVEDCDDKKILSAEFEKNREAEPAFRGWLIIELMNKGRKELNDVYNAGAEVAHCSQETIKRYLGKMISEHGICQISKEIIDQSRLMRYVEFKPDYDVFKMKIGEMLSDSID